VPTDLQHHVAELWAAAWERILGEHPDIEACLASLPPAVQRLEASAARWAARVVRGEADAIELEAKLQEFSDAVIAALASQDHARSQHLCGDCGTHDEQATLTGLGNVVCRTCLREAQP
jgi:hypothetical protein